MTEWKRLILCVASLSLMDLLSLRDIYDFVKYLNEKDLFGLYESSFIETKKKFPLIDEKEGSLTQKNEDIRSEIGDFENYKDLDKLKKEILRKYKEISEIPENILQDFVKSLFMSFERNIMSHENVREKYDHILLKDMHEKITQSYQCPPHGMIQTPAGMCRVDILTRGFLGKFRIILASQYETLGEMNHRKVLELVENMEGDPEYPAKNLDLTSEVCKILIESFDCIPTNSKDARAAFSIVLSKVTGISEFLAQCELPVNYDEFNFQAYVVLTNLMLNEGDIEAAKKYLEKAHNYTKGEDILTIFLEGRIFFEEYKFDEAIKKFEKIINTADFYEKRDILHYLGWSYYMRSFLEKSLEYWKELEKIVDERLKRAVVLGNIGAVYHDMGDLDEALKYYKDALRIHREVSNKLGEAGVLGNIGNVYGDMGDLDEALKYHEDALESFREIGNKLGEATQFGNIGVVCRNKGDLNKALKYYKDALRIHREIGNKLGEATQFGNIGNVYGDMGDLNKALKYYKDALRIHREIGNKLGEANQLGNIGIVYRDKGDLDEALRYHENALEIKKKIGNKLGEANQLGNIGMVYRDMGDLNKALKYYKDALRIHREIGNKIGKANGFGNIGIVYLDLGDLNKALKYYKDALRIHREIGNKLGEANQLGNIGVVYLDLGDLDEALRYHENALEIHKRIGNKMGEASQLGGIGIVLKRMKRKNDSLRFLNEALEIFEKIGAEKQVEVVSYHILEIVLNNQNLDI